MSDSVLVKGFSDCGMSCCRTTAEEPQDNVTGGDCCREKETENCACRIEHPDQKAVPVNFPVQKITFNETVYYALPEKCVFCIVPENNYAFGEQKPPLYFISQSRIFSGRSPPDSAV